MSNIVEAIRSMVNTIVDDEPKPPITILEASNLWLYFAGITEAIAFEEIGLNTTEDDELKGILMDAKKMCSNQSERIKKFMIKEGISLPPTSEEKPKSESKSIPLGAKLTDSELANSLSLKIVTMVIEGATASAQAVRTDVGMIWLELLTESLTFGMTLKTKMRKRGWAKIPPSYTPSM